MMNFDQKIDEMIAEAKADLMCQAGFKADDDEVVCGVPECGPRAGQVEWFVNGEWADVEDVRLVVANAENFFRVD